MKLRLNPERVEQLVWIMEKTGHTNPTHCIQVMISTIYNNLNKNANRNKPKSPSEDTHGNQSSTSM